VQGTPSSPTKHLCYIPKKIVTRKNQKLAAQQTNAVRRRQTTAKKAFELEPESRPEEAESSHKRCSTLFQNQRGGEKTKLPSLAVLRGMRSDGEELVRREREKKKPEAKAQTHLDPTQKIQKGNGDQRDRATPIPRND